MKIIADVRPLIVNDYATKVKYTRILFYLILFLFSYSAIKFFIGLKQLQIKPLLKSTNTYLFFITLIYAALFLTCSDPISDGGYIPVRLSTVLFLFMFCWLSTLKYPLIIKVISFITVLIISFNISYTENKILSEEDNVIKKITEASLLIEDNTTILPVRNSDKMLEGHYSNFLGMKKPVVILENYEASSPHFPLSWNRAELPVIYLGDTVISNVCFFEKFPENSPYTSIVDYAFIWGGDYSTIDSCQKALISIIEKNYDLIYYSGNPVIKLYRIKPIFYH
jgi:hypothetical protein